MAQNSISPSHQRVLAAGTVKVGELVDPNPFVKTEIRHVTETKVDGTEVKKVNTIVYLKDSTTTIIFGLSPHTGRYAVLVRDELKTIPARGITTATGSGYADKVDAGDPLKTGARKAARESGIDWEDLEVLETFNFTGEVGAWAYPQNIVGRHFYTGALVKAFPEQKESRGGWLLDLFPSRETAADPALMQEYRERSQEHEVLLVASLFARTYLLGEGLCNKYGEPVA
jgi:hypothetical protein